MSRREEMNDRAVENAGIAQALAELIEKNRTQAVELEALARLVQAETAAVQEREAEQAARLGETLGELAEAVAAVEIEKQRRIEAEELAAGLIAAVDVIQATLMRLPSAGSSALRGIIRDAAGNDQVAAVQSEATPATAPAEAAQDSDTSDLVAADDEHRTTRADMVEQRTVPVVVTLSAAEAMALETLAEQAGHRDRIDFAAHLIRDGLRRTGWTPVPDEERPRRE